MKRFIIIAVVVGMFTWAIYDFVIKPDDAALPEENTESVDSNLDEDKGKDADGAEDEEAQEGEEAQGDEGDEEIGLDQGDLAPDFELNTLDGDTVKLSDFRGEKVMVNFWATWCPPCRAEMPDMQKFHEDKDVVILAVDLTETEDDFDDIPEFIDEFGVTFRV